MSFPCFLMIRFVPTGGAGMSHLPEKGSIGKSPDLPFLLAIFLLFRILRTQESRCCGLTESSETSYKQIFFNHGNHPFLAVNCRSHTPKEHFLGTVQPFFSTLHIVAFVTVCLRFRYCWIFRFIKVIK